MTHNFKRKFLAISKEAKSTPAKHTLSLRAARVCVWKNSVPTIWPSNCHSGTIWVIAGNTPA